VSADLLRPAAATLREGFPAEADYLLARLTIGSGGCWTWTGARNIHGYGKVKRAKKTLGVHRWVWLALNGSLGDGIELDHLCRNRACFNPEHLEPVTGQENIRRGHASRGVYEDCPITGRVEVGLTLANGLRMELPYSRDAVTALARAESADEFEAMAKVFGAEVAS
jgi:hypothetical protein